MVISLAVKNWDHNGPKIIRILMKETPIEIKHQCAHKKMAGFEVKGYLACIFAWNQTPW